MFFITPTFNTFCLSLIDGIVFYAVMTIFQAYNDLFELKINKLKIAIVHLKIGTLELKIYNNDTIKT